MSLATDLVKRLRQDTLPPLERLRQLLDYDPDKGTFRWKVDVSNRQAGDPAGSVLPDRHCITIDGKNYQARRIAWYLLYGEIPQSKLYARNGDMTDHSAANITDDKHQANTLPMPDKPLVSVMPPLRSKKPAKQTVFILVNKPSHHYNFALLVNFLQMGERSQQNNRPLSPFLS